MNLNLNGKKALLMASTKGLGFGCAKILIEEGVKCVINGRNEKQGYESELLLGEKSSFFKADITNSSDRERLYQFAQEKLGQIDIIIINSDGPSTGSFLSKNSKNWMEAFELLFIPGIDLIRKCVPRMKENGYGRIINRSSISAKEIENGIPLTSGIKPGFIGALKSFANEVASSGITANSILPGPFDTDLLRRYISYKFGNTNNNFEEYVENLPMKRLGMIEEFGSLCAYLCSKQAGYITGQSFVIDGGKSVSLF